MWLCNPKHLCNKHLNAERYEIIKAVGNLRNTGRWANSLIKKGFLEPQNFRSRFDALTHEMLERGMNAGAVLNLDGIEITKGKVDRNKSLLDLINRCPECRGRFFRGFDYE